MKAILSLISFLLFLNSCTFRNYEKFTLKTECIETVSMKNGLDNLPIELNSSQIKYLINKLNKSKKNGPTKYMKKYFIEIVLKNDSTIIIGANNSIFSVNSLFSYKTSNNFFDDYWIKIEGDKNSWKLYKPVELKSQNLIQTYSQKFDSLQLHNLQSVLDYYEIENKIVNNKLYHKEVISDELNWNYMTKSNDEKWLQEHISTSR